MSTNIQNKPEGNNPPAAPPPGNNQNAQGMSFGGFPIWKMILIFGISQSILSFFNKPDPKKDRFVMTNIFEENEPIV